ncbi:MAG: sigma-70 family RNA polymerase sigma factor [Ruminococcus sp.]|uniref:sigma-70 family RNA polymerase sigma factor n=1 Tax=Ruminococcus sp. TaxID=41978 RepID=UPI0025E6C8C5|nr:sigma-70 family RNA polymerase sigma factor [Ruminococcus sp.]MCR5602026.1 sigma-70 family RNA polymerase sigma factor [Ruminococcus sp.]
MARNSKTYSDSFTGEADKGIRAVLGYDDDDEDAVKLKRVLLKVINNELTARQREIIVLYYFKNMNMVNIGKKLGITTQAVSDAITRGRRKLFMILQYYI